MKKNLKSGSPVVVNACDSQEVQTRVTVSPEEIAALAFSYCRSEDVRAARPKTIGSVRNEN